MAALLCQLRIVELIRNESVCENNVGKNCFISYLFHRKKESLCGMGKYIGIILTEVKKNDQASSVEIRYSKRQSFLK